MTTEIHSNVRRKVGFKKAELQQRRNTSFSMKPPSTKEVSYWNFRMRLNNELKYARKSLRTRSKTTAIEKGKEAYLEIFANRKMGKTYFSLNTKEGVNNYLEQGVNHYLEHRKKDVEIGLIVKGRYTTIKTHLQHFLDFIGKDTKLKEFGTY